MKRMALRLSTALVLVSSFAVITGVLLVGQNLQRVLTLWGESLQMTVYIAENASQEAIQEIETSLKNNDKVDKLEFVSNEKALSQFRLQMASYAPDLLADNDLLNAIPSSFQFSVASKVSPENQLSVMQEITGVLKNLSGVDEVSYGQDWVKSYSQVAAAINWTGLTFALVIIGCALFVISNCIRSSVHQRREEIEVLELIGATAHFIRKPFLREGLLLCFCSSLLGITLAWGLFEATQNSMQSQLSFLQLSQHIQFLKAETIILLLAGSLLLGWVATYMCLRSLNDGWAASQKKQS